MSEALRAIPPRRRTGEEPLHLDGAAHGRLIGFWAWAYSGLVGNTLRGALAEYIVALALEVADGTRVDWDSVDIRLPDGPRVEVKSAACLQEWDQTKLSAVSFSIAPAEGWNAVTGEVDPARLRRADVYVFCLLDHQNKKTLDPLDLAQWTFYVLPTSVLDEHRCHQRTLTLSSLLALDPLRTDFQGLRSAVLAPVLPQGTRLITPPTSE
ncbi:hypothetical protein OHS33_35225 [Streptomyces sp. NBC_00536]|uniref:hypothetical protein n=1 Tax=Streptomyces sp. NBC_00536 TaxID=2975769 RepID=UPI002E8234D4|nr:hypothetical protein [Streptomyces sp. NBC_00536]WUC83166.1 hypothetical protein OHS33_35225 [Streptomyces sp. NBC_00536]